MKKIKILGFIVILMMYSISCEELPDPAGERGVAVVPYISGLNPGVFDVNDLQNSFVQFSVNIPEGTSVTKVELICSFNNDHSDVRITEITTFPALIKIFSADATQKLGKSLASLERGDVFDFELLVTSGGRTTRSTPLVIPVACAYSVNMSTGNYHLTSDPEWGSAGDIVLSADVADPYKIYITELAEMDGLVQDLGPLVMYIDPVTYSVTVPRKAIASDAFGYHNLAYEGSGSYSTCDGTYTLSLKPSVDEGSWSAYWFVFTRK